MTGAAWTCPHCGAVFEVEPPKDRRPVPVRPYAAAKPAKFTSARRRAAGMKVERRVSPAVTCCKKSDRYTAPSREVTHARA